jgi:hypothetical protein
VARFTGVSIGSPGVPKLNVGSSILLARFLGNLAERWILAYRSALAHAAEKTLQPGNYRIEARP